MVMLCVICFFFSSRRRHTRCALVTGVQTCALPILDADVYVMADGDATYDASAAPLMVRRLLEDQLDMVVGARASEIDAAYRRGHRLGNVMLTGILARMFGRSFSDILSG